MANQIETIVNVQRDNRNRVTTFFRGILVFPVFIYLCTLMQTFHWGVSSTVITIPVILALVVRGKYPSYILTFNHAMMELSNRVIAYMLFLTDDYPSIERNDNVAVLFPDVEGGRKLSRWQPIFKVIFVASTVPPGRKSIISPALHCTAPANVASPFESKFPASAVDTAFL